MHRHAIRPLRAVAVALLLAGSALAAPAGAAQDANAFISNLGTQAIPLISPTLSEGVSKENPIHARSTSRRASL